MSRISLCTYGLFLISVLTGCSTKEAKEEYKADICVYSGNASGVMAAIAAAQRNQSVILVEHSRWLGGFVGGGSRVLRDCVYADDIGGLTRMIMQKDVEMGGLPSLEDYTKARGHLMGFGPHNKQLEFRKLFVELARKHNIKVVYEHRLSKVLKNKNKIKSILLDYAPPQKDGCPSPKATVKNAIKIQAKVFIDASYEGDLMAEAGVSYTVGRESRTQYNESLAGQRNLKVFDISPYLKENDPSSGLLPMIDKAPFQEGAASRHIMPYNFRLYWQKNGAMPGEPTNYNPEEYALVTRSLKKKNWRKYITWPQNNHARAGMVSSSIPGLQSDYPDADWSERSKIWRAWIDHVKIMHKLTGSKLGLMKGEYPDTNDFPHFLYVRLARRMISDYVMTQHDLMLQTDIENPIGLGYYMVDIYPSRLVATPDGKVGLEGEVAEMISPGPYQIPYESIVPRQEQCENLLVPVCISATHLALSSIRMEPTYMIMGEAAGIAANQAIHEKTAVQKINQKIYRNALLDAGMVIEWDGKGYENKKTYDGRPSYWISHPGQYSKKPYETLYKGQR